MCYKTNIHIFFRQSGFQTNKVPQTKNLIGQLPVTLWVQLLPFSEKVPDEFKTKTGSDGLNVEIRKWCIFDLNEVKDMVFQEVKFGEKHAMVAKIGSGPTDMPIKKCWWLDCNNERLSQIEDIQMFSKNLNIAAYPALLDIQNIQTILNCWKGNIFANNQILSK